MLPQSVKLVMWMRDRSKLLRKNSMTIDPWVGSYLDRCFKLTKPVVLLTQWCVAKDLEIRFQKQGNQFIPTSGERDLAFKEIPMVLELFADAGLGVQWFVTLNRSYLDMGRVRPDIEAAYAEMIRSLFGEASIGNAVLFLNWEDDILGGRPQPNKAVLENFFKKDKDDAQGFVLQKSFAMDVERHAPWAKTVGNPTDEEIESDVKFKIACEAEEGRMLCAPDSPIAPFGMFLLAPLEVQERIDFFSLRAPEFKKRLAPILKTYPWRYEE